MRKTQKELVLDHLKHYGKITTMEAIMRYGITRLSARIYDLRHDDGYVIGSKRILKREDGRTIVHDEFYLEESA